jgi:hypothetical protein
VGRVAVFAFVAAAVVFCVVQDRTTAAGVREYVARQRLALSGHSRPVGIDDVMGPANRRAVEQGLLWGAVTGITALQCGALARRFRRG